jgi:hypothetical protein
VLATTLVDSARKSASAAGTFALGQLDAQVREFAGKLRATSGSLTAMTKQLRADPIISSAAPLMEQAEVAISGAAAYLESRGVGTIAIDLEKLSRSRPIEATLVASLLGFALSRAVKASSMRRNESTEE